MDAIYVHVAYTRKRKSVKTKQKERGLRQDEEVRAKRKRITKINNNPHSPSPRTASVYISLNKNT